MISPHQPGQRHRRWFRLF